MSKVLKRQRVRTSRTVPLEKRTRAAERGNTAGPGSSAASRTWGQRFPGLLFRSAEGGITGWSPCSRQQGILCRLVNAPCNLTVAYLLRLANAPYHTIPNIKPE